MIGSVGLTVKGRRHFVANLRLVAMNKNTTQLNLSYTVVGH